MRRVRAKRGISILEMLGASAIATIVGGATVVLMNSVREIYQTQTTFNQLSGYLDGATAVLRQDIWGATVASGTTGSGVSAGVCPNDYLRLTVPSPANPVVYCLDNTTDPSNVSLRRTENGGNARHVARFVVQGSNTTASFSAGLATINLQVKRSVNGRDYFREVLGITYRLQTP